jgi:hypothetical protein
MKDCIESITAWVTFLKKRVIAKDYSTAQNIITLIHTDLRILNEIFAIELEDGD